jgi:hypothetical protein
MELHRTQKIVAESKARYRVVNCGRQWGKTFLSCSEMMGRAYYLPDQSIAYFATTRDQARNIAWQNLKDITRPLWSRKPNETLLELYIRNQYGNENMVALRGFENVETARGQQFNMIILDEVASMPRFKYAWEAILQPTLLFRKGEAMFISTPKGYNHFNELYLKERDSKEWQSFTFTTYDNPYIDKQEIENIRQQVTTDYFNQEYLAQFTRFTGLIYKEFNQSTHVDYFEHEFNSHAEYLFGLDFAVRGYTASVCAKLVPSGDIYILDEYKTDNDTALNHGTRIKEMLLKYADMERWTGYADPAGWIKNQQRGSQVWSLADEYLEMGLPIAQANNQVIPGINYVRQQFQSNKVHIHIRCTKLVDEIMQYQWKDQPDKQVGMKNAPEEVRKVNDHIIDATRYMLYSKPTPPDEARPYTPGMPLVFQMKFDPQEEKKDTSIFNTDLY